MMAILGYSQAQPGIISRTFLLLQENIQDLPG